ncbi:hypothetical protein DEJ44_22675 [Streptomyces venezuelae]|uniref:hypothetical protein n=1 Tax=Streptomyces venezuelae TaxID=54571 RepID=UPI00123A2B03|nr:hypothetical protein [Streptomyces venezuelae]QES08145.1 hypothetical protein DEJ44_22675 [Streptomyces venezuelae]
MKLPVVIHRARTGADEFRVVRPARPLPRAVLVDHDRYLGAYLDQEAARSIAGLWTLAARSPRSLIHIPLRTPRSPDRAVPDPAGARLDLVLLHHSLQFAPSRWKEVRARLDPGRPHTANLPEANPPVTAPGTRHHRENRDLLHEHVRAGTLFMTGSAKAFHETAHHFLDIAHQGPTHTGTRHYCTQLHANAGILGKSREIHIEYCAEWTDEETPATTATAT